jgi:hypothetical protein
MTRPTSRQAGFSFIEVLFAFGILLVGSVAILSLFALGASEMVQRRIDRRVSQVWREVLVIAQDAVDRQDPGKAPEAIKAMPLSQPDLTVDVDFQPSPHGGPRWDALAVIRLRGQPVRALPPIPVARSTLDPR